MANYREEHIRNNRRLARQVVGAAALLLALIGLFTVLGWIVGLVRAALDDTDLRNEYRDRLYGMVMLDPVAFDDVNSVDEGIFKQAAIWGTVYQVQNSGGSLDQYERDPDTGSALIPALEIDTYISNLLGPDYQVTEARSARRSSSTSTTKKSRPIWCPSPVRWRCTRRRWKRSPRRTASAS